MASHYLMKYKGTYRILPELDLETHDVPRDANGNIDDDWDGLYISCRHGNQIYFWGFDSSHRGLLVAYIPSVKRGHSIIKELDKQGIYYENYEETDVEILFRFKAKDIAPVATLLQAKTSGANISPFSSKNLPKADVQIPTEKMNDYKAIIAPVPKNDLLLIHHLTDSFLNDFLQKRQRKTDKQFDYRRDIRKRCMARQVKEYIWTMGYWQDYLSYLQKEINKQYQ